MHQAALVEVFKLVDELIVAV